MSAEERGGHDTLMWEAQAAGGKWDELIDWVERTAVLFLRDQPQCRGADVCVSADDRAVIIARCDGAPAQVPAALGEPVNSPAHQWPFRHHPVPFAHA